MRPAAPESVFLMPTIQNPTLTIISEADRQEIVAIARQYNVWLIEDNIYGELVEGRPPAARQLRRSEPSTSAACRNRSGRGSRRLGVLPGKLSRRG